MTAIEPESVEMEVITAEINKAQGIRFNFN